MGAARLLRPRRTIRGRRIQLRDRPPRRRTVSSPMRVFLRNTRLPRQRMMGWIGRVRRGVCRVRVWGVCSRVGSGREYVCWE